MGREQHQNTSSIVDIELVIERVVMKYARTRSHMPGWFHKKVEHDEFMLG